MPEITALAGQVAGLFSLAAFVPYIIAILRGKTVPNRTTWWIWTVVGFMLGSSYFSSGANHTIWVPVSYVVGPFITAILSVKYGEGGWTKFDRFCLFGALASIILWWIFDSPLVALIINLFIDFLGALPTIKKAYLEPEKEDRFAWTLFFAGNLFNLFAVERWIFAIAVYPIFMFLVDGAIVTLVYSGKNRRF